MLFWVAAAILTIVCVAAALLPLLRAQPRVPAASGHDLEVYKDQLAEIERDSAAGLIAGEDAATARAEVARRILKVSAETGRRICFHSFVRHANPRSPWRRSCRSFPGASIHRSARRKFPTSPSPRVKIPLRTPLRRLWPRPRRIWRKIPQDARGWEVLAPIYSRMGRFDDAVKAFSQAAKLNSPSAARESGLGEALTGAAGGKVSPDAKAAFATGAGAGPQRAESAAVPCHGAGAGRQDGGGENRAGSAACRRACGCSLGGRSSSMRWHRSKNHRKARSPKGLLKPTWTPQLR